MAPISPPSLRPVGKRNFSQAFDRVSSSDEATSKRQRLDTPILSWLDDIQSAAVLDRPQSAPPRSSSFKLAPSMQSSFQYTGHSCISKDMDETASQTTNKSSGTQQTATSIRPSNPLYDNVLRFNNVHVDPLGEKITREIQDLVDDMFFKSRPSPPISGEEFKSAAKKMNAWGTKTEAAVSQIHTTPLLPIDEPRLSVAANAQWPSDALPDNPDYSHSISAPKPDYCVGYGAHTGFSVKQMNVLDHSHAVKYCQPASSVYNPFLIVELKSEGTGGVLLQAERQAAGGGTFAVSALQWLCSEAGVSVSSTDTVAISMVASGRLGCLWIHWYSSVEEIYYASKFGSFFFDKRDDVQVLHNAIKNILDWGLGTRLELIKRALDSLNPTPLHWSQVKMKKVNQNYKVIESREVTAEDEDEDDMVSLRQSITSTGSGSFSSSRGRHPSRSKSIRSSQSRNSSNTRRTSVSKISKSAKPLSKKTSRS